MTMSLDAEMMRMDCRQADAIDEKNPTPLHKAAGYGETEMVSYLIRAGADVNALDNEGQAPLHNASCHGHLLTSSKLIEAGALVDLPDNRGWTPLAFAIARNLHSERISPRYWKVIDLLLNSGANPYSKSASGRTCLSRIKSREDRRTVRITHLLNELKTAGQDEKSRSDTINKYLKVEDFFELVKTGDENLELLKSLTTSRLLNSHLTSFDAITPLHRAAGYNHIESAKFFLNQGADPNAVDKFGRIPLHNAAQYGHVEMIELLVKENSDINRQDQLGYSPLHVAASNRTFFACLELIQLGANINLRCQAQKLPYDLAETDDVKEVLKPDHLKYEVNLIPSTSGQAVYIDIKKKYSETEPIQPQSNSFFSELMLDSSSPERLFNNPSHNIKKVTLLESDWRYEKVKRRMLESIVVHNSDSGGQYTSYEILGIELVLNEEVWSNYRLMCQRLERKYGVGSVNERLLFHGSKYIDSIEKDGFDESYAKRNGMFGAGIYFAEHSSKANQYTFGWGNGCQDHQDKSCYICERKMVYAQVALGRTLISREAMPDCAHTPPGCSSVSGLPESTDNLNYPEWVIYRGDQAYPLFVIRYRISE